MFNENCSFKNNEKNSNPDVMNEHALNIIDKYVFYSYAALPLPSYQSVLSFQFLFKNTIWSITTDDNWLQSLLTMPVENILLDGIDVSGIDKYFHARPAIFGNST